MHFHFSFVFVFLEEITFIGKERGTSDRTFMPRKIQCQGKKSDFERNKTREGERSVRRGLEGGRKNFQIETPKRKELVGSEIGENETSWHAGACKSHCEVYNLF